MISIPADVIYQFIWSTMLGYVGIVLILAITIGVLNGEKK